MSASLSVDELLLLGQLAGYTKAETAQLMLEADNAKRVRGSLSENTKGE